MFFTANDASYAESLSPWQGKIAMRDPNRLTVEEFFAWHEHIEGRYELVDGHIVPHPDYVTLEDLAAPSNRHAAVVFKIGNLLAPQLPILEPERRTITVYRRDEGPQTYLGSAPDDPGSDAVALSPTVSLPFEVFA